MKFTEEMLVLCDIFKRNRNENQLLNSILKLINNVIEPDTLLQRNQSNENILLICEYIKKNSTQKFDLDKLAKSFYLSKFHLIRIFKKEMGVTPNQYHIQAKIRLIKAEMFNVQSETDLAMNLNLYDQSHLCKLFKRQMGISIKDYRMNRIRE